MGVCNFIQEYDLVGKELGIFVGEKKGQIVHTDGSTENKEYYIGKVIRTYEGIITLETAKGPSIYINEDFVISFWEINSGLKYENAVKNHL